MIEDTRTRQNVGIDCQPNEYGHINSYNENGQEIPSVPDSPAVAEDHNPNGPCASMGLVPKGPSVPWHRAMKQVGPIVVRLLSGSSKTGGVLGQKDQKILVATNVIGRHQAT